jgi:hypothetical protein
LTGDESGTFRAPPRPGDRYYIVATVAVVGQRLRHQLGRLAQQLRAEMHHPGIGRPFHATDDLRRVNEAVLGLLARQNITIDITVVDKQTLPRELRRRPRRLFDLMWFHHLIHALPDFCDPPHKVQLRIAQLSAADAEKFRPTYLAATMVAYGPFLDAKFKEQRARTPDGPFFEVPALLFSDLDARSDRLGQAADYACWAAHRLWEYGDREAFDTLFPVIRSARVVSFSPIPESQFVPPIVLVGGLRIKPHVAYLRRFHADAQYLCGPGDAFQALVAFQQAADAGRTAEAAHRACLLRPRTGTGDGQRALLLTMMDCHRQLPDVETTLQMEAAIGDFVRAMYPGRFNDAQRNFTLAEARFAVALRYGRVRDDKNASLLYEEIIERFGQDNSTFVASVVAKSRVNLAHIRRREGGMEEARLLYRAACEMSIADRSDQFDEPAGRATLCLLEDEAARGDLSSETRELGRALIARLKDSSWTHAAAWIEECEAYLKGEPPPLAAVQPA